MGLINATVDLFPPALPVGFAHHAGALDAAMQAQLLAAVRAVEAEAPLTRVRTKMGGLTSAAMTNCGAAGWWSDARGYRYERTNPATGRPWPAMPAAFRAALGRIAAHTPWPDFAPDACLINYYAAGARMGLHQDRDERDFGQPIITICLGDAADFLVGGANRGDATIAVVVRSGDAMVMGGPARLFYHGIRKIYPGTGPIAGLIGRYSLTLRKAL
jgi:alkylated DNA repair protein (DNA oxidative demethylase)